MWAVMKKYYRNKILDGCKNIKTNNELTYKLIERFVKIAKTHRNIGDQQKGFIQKAILDSISSCNEMLYLRYYRKM